MDGFLADITRSGLTAGKVVLLGLIGLNLFTFLLYGLDRAIDRPGISLVLTIISLGLRVVLAYVFEPLFQETGIWAAIPIGWILADIAGLCYYKIHQDHLLQVPVTVGTAA